MTHISSWWLRLTIHDITSGGCSLCWTCASMSAPTCIRTRSPSYRNGTMRLLSCSGTIASRRISTLSVCPCSMPLSTQTVSVSYLVSYRLSLLPSFSLILRLMGLRMISYANTFCARLQSMAHSSCTCMNSRCGRWSSWRTAHLLVGGSGVDGVKEVGYYFSFMLLIWDLI